MWKNKSTHSKLLWSMEQGGSDKQADFESVERGAF